VRWQKGCRELSERQPAGKEKLFPESSIAKSENGFS